MIPSYVSRRWQERGYSEAQARAYYEPDQATREDLLALHNGGLLSLHEEGGWTRLPPLKRGDVAKLSFTSPLQKIQVFEDSGITSVRLNDTIQFEGREHQYHYEMMVAVPLSLLLRPRRVLILGGGFGLAAHMALHFDEVETIHVVELDPHVIRLAQETRSLRKINGKSLLHPKVKVFRQDAFQFVEQDSPGYDLIVYDCDLTATRQSDSLSLEMLLAFFTNLPLRLSPGGALSMRVPIDSGHMDMVEAAEVARAQPVVGGELERAAALARSFWPDCFLFEFLSLYSGRELMVLAFPDHRPQVQRRLAGASQTCHRLLEELFPAP
ncbi:hypothetical protein IV102_35515 [bacterium]|nr:hypothetical protein [bacterium]